SSRATVPSSAATAVWVEAGFVVVRVVSATAGSVGAERTAGEISIVHGAATAAGMFVGSHLCVSFFVDTITIDLDISLTQEWSRPQMWTDRPPCMSAAAGTLGAWLCTGSIDLRPSQRWW